VQVITEVDERGPAAWAGMRTATAEGTSSIPAAGSLAPRNASTTRRFRPLVIHAWLWLAAEANVLNRKEKGHPARGQPF